MTTLANLTVALPSADLRDRLASLALVELMRRPSKQAYALADFMTAPGPDPAGPYDDMAREAYAIADAMLRARGDLVQSRLP